VIAGGAVEGAAGPSNSNAGAWGQMMILILTQLLPRVLQNHVAVLPRLDDIMNPGNLNVDDDDVDYNPAKMPATYIYWVLSHAR